MSFNTLLSWKRNPFSICSANLRFCTTSDRLVISLCNPVRSTNGKQYTMNISRKRDRPSQTTIIIPFHDVSSFDGSVSSGRKSCPLLFITSDNCGGRIIRRVSPPLRRKLLAVEFDRITFLSEAPLILLIASFSKRSATENIDGSSRTHRKTSWVTKNGWKAFCARSITRLMLINLFHSSSSSLAGHCWMVLLNWQMSLKIMNTARMHTKTIGKEKKRATAENPRVIDICLGVNV